MPMISGYGWDAVQQNIAELAASGVPHQNATAAAYALGRVSFFKRYPNGALPEWLAYPRKFRLRRFYNQRGEPLHDSREYAENPAPSPLREYNELRQRFVDMQEQLERMEARTGRFGAPINQEKQIALQEEMRVMQSRINELRQLIYPKKNPAPRTEQPNQRQLAQAARLFEEFTGKRAKRVTKHTLPDLPEVGLVFGKLVQVGYESARDGKLYRHTFRKRSRPLLVATPDGKMVLIVGGRYAFTDAGIEDR